MFEKTIELLEHTNTKFIVLFIFISGLVRFLGFYIKHYENARRFFRLHNEIKEPEEDTIENILRKEDNKTRLKTQKEIQKQKETTEFEKYFKIYAEEKRREMIIDFHNKYEIEITWKEIKAAFKYFKFEKETLSVKVNKYDKLSFNVSLVLAVLLILIGFFGLFLILSIIDELSIKKYIGLLIMTIPFILLGYGIIRINNGLSCAIKISGILKKK